MDKKVRTIRDFVTTDVTPFIDLKDLKWCKFVKDGKKIRGSDDNGEFVKQYSAEYGNGFKDEGKFTKLFGEGNNGMRDLSVPGIKVLCFICHHLKINSEEIVLQSDVVASWLGYKYPKNVYVGIVELIEHGFIARKTGKDQIFFVNPCKIFNGNRGSVMSNPARKEYGEQLMADFYEKVKFRIK